MLNGGTLGVTTLTFTNSVLFSVGSGEQVTTLKSLAGGTLTFTKGLLINSNATLTGSGTISGSGDGISLTNGANLSPGLAGVGNLTIGGSNLTWNAGATYRCEVTNFASAAGMGYDTINVSSQLSLVADAGSSSLVIRLSSLGVPAANFSPNAAYNLRIASCLSLTGFDPTQFTVNTNDFLNSSAGTWGVMSFDNNLYVTYRPTVDSGLAYTWAAPSNGNWTVDGNWVGGVAPSASSPEMQLTFGGNASDPDYYATNNHSGQFQLNRLTLTNANAAATNVLAGNSLQFWNADAAIEQGGSGSFIVSNTVLSTTNLVLGGAGSGTINLTNLTVAGSLTKRGSSPVVMRGTNSFWGPLVLDAVGGSLRVDNLNALATNDVQVNNGTLQVNIGAASFGVTNRSIRVSGSGSLLTNSAAFVVGPYAPVTVANGARLAINGALTVADRGTVANSLTVTNGGQLFSTAASYVGNVASNASMLVTGGGAMWDVGMAALTIGSGGGATNNSLRIDGSSGGARVTNLAAVTVGNAAGSGFNQLVLTNGGQLFSTAASLIGNASSNNSLLVAGNSAKWDAGNQNITVGSGVARDNLLVIDGQGVTGGAVVSNVNALYVGYSQSAGGEVSVLKGGSLYCASVLGSFGGGSYNQIKVSGGPGIVSTLASSGAFTFGHVNGASSNQDLLVDGKGEVDSAVLAASTISLGVHANDNRLRISVLDGGLLMSSGGAAIGSTLSALLVNNARYLCGGGISLAGTSNTVAITNGGVVISAPAAGLGIYGKWSTFVVSGTNSLWDASDSQINIGSFLGGSSSNRLIVENKGVITNAGTLIMPAYGQQYSPVNSRANSLILRSGGKLFHSSGFIWIGSAVAAAEQSVQITGPGSMWDAGGNGLYMGYGATTGGMMRVEDSGLVTNMGGINIGSVYTNQSGHSMTIATGGKVFSAGPCGVANAANNTGIVVTISGADSLWYLSNSNLTFGIGTSSNNTLTIDQDGTLDAIGTLTVAGGLNAFNLLGGTLGVANTTYTNGLFTAGDGTQSTTLKALGGTLSFAGGLRIPSNAWLTGIGTVDGGSMGVTLTNGATLAPGLSRPGTVTIGGSNLIWSSGGIYHCEITNLTLGFGVGWDVVNVSSQLLFVGGSPKFEIKMDSKGVASGFNPALSYSLKILSYGSMTGYDTNLISLNTNDFSTVPASTWYLTNDNNAVYLAYDGSNPYGDANLVWKVPSNGVWSGAGNWVGGVAPTAGGDPTNVLSFGDNGTRYVSTNNLPGTFQLNKLVLANLSGITNVICGSNLAFTVNGATAPRVDYQMGGGTFIVSNGLTLGDGMFFGGAGGGTLVLASNVLGGQPLLKQGPGTLALAVSNQFANPVVVTNASAGVIRLDHAKALGNNSIVVSDGGTLRSTPAFVFGSNAVYRSGQVTGSGSTWSNADLLISTNAVVTVENGGALMGKVSVASWGTVPYGLIVTNGGQVVANGGGTLGGGSVTNSRILVTGPGSVFAGGATLFTLSGTNNTLWVDNGGMLTNMQTSMTGDGNGIIVTNGSKWFTYSAFQSLASGTNALTVITGTNSLLYLAGVVYIGAGGSNNEVRIENGAISSNQSFNLSGESPGVSCRLVVNNASCYFSDDTKIGRTATMCGNQMIVTNGGQIYNSKASTLTHVSYFGGSNNLLAVYADSVYRMGPAGAPGSLRLGANGNKVLIDGGTITDLTFLIGPGATNFVNSIIVTNNGTLTLAASGSAIGNAVGCYSNWVYVGQGGKLDGQGFNLQIGAAAGCWNNRLEAGPNGLVTNLGTLTIGISSNGTNFLLMAGGNVMANSLIATSALNTVNFPAGTLSVRSSVVSNATLFMVGDGNQSATLNLLGGTNLFVDGLVITNSATLAGNGIVLAGTTTVYGTVNPGGTSVGALTNWGSYSLQETAISRVDLTSAAGPGVGWDFLSVSNGTLTLGGFLKPVLADDFQPTNTASYVIMTNVNTALSGYFANGNDDERVIAYGSDLIQILGSFRVGISNQYVILNNYQPGASASGSVFSVY